MPNKIKTNIKIYPQKQGLQRREELAHQIMDHGTFLPQSILHEDLDKGMLEFVGEHLKVISGGEIIPVNKIIYTVQRWAEYSQNWSFSDPEGNVKLPFITVIRKPDPQPGSNPQLIRTIPERKTFTVAINKTWDGNQMGATLYKMPQPVPIDISYDVIIVCDKMRDLNKFNKIVLQRFASRQGYALIKGHYIPVVLESISDESPFDNLDGRRYYQQVYNFRMEGILIDEDEFEITPALNRAIIFTELQKEIQQKTNIQTDLTEITIKSFTSYSGQTLFSVGEKIGLLVGVSKNGFIQKRGFDYNHNETTSNIIFNSGNTVGNKIEIIYISKQNLRLIDSNREIRFYDKWYVYDGNNPFFIGLKNINILFYTVNGVFYNGDNFTFDNSNLTLSMQAALAPGNIIIIYYYLLDVPEKNFAVGTSPIFTDGFDYDFDFDLA